MKKYINYFALFAILGFIVETIYAVIKNINYNSGFLKGPWTPIYGFGILVILILGYFIKCKGFKKYLIYFLFSSVLITVIEVIGGVLIEKIFGIQFWGYEHHSFPIFKYASLFMLMIWGIVATFVNYIVVKRIDKYILKVPLIFSVSIIILMLIDFIYTLNNGI